MYQWRVLPFGLSNSPAIFQRIKSSFLLVKYTNPDGTTITTLGSFIQVYMDDLLIYSKTPQDHLRHVGFVSGILKANTIYLNPKKCEFNKPEVQFLGRLVSQKGVRPDPAKVSVMQE
jgi:Reverse transcriptase (RNA-dependent DNA polymerase)